MSVTIAITVEDVNDIMDTYESIQLYSAATVGGSYTVIDTITLVADTFYYSYLDTVGDESWFYKYRYYNSVGPVASDFSNPFSPYKRSRTSILRQAIEEYNAGYVVALTGTPTTTILYTNDYRVKDGKTTGIGKGGWIRVSSGAIVGEISNISDIDHSAGTITVSPALSSPPVSGDLVEWHWLITPTEWLNAINRGLERYQVLDRIPVVAGGTGTDALSSVPWLYSKEQVAGLWRTFSNNMPEVPWDWWNILDENGSLTLLSYPPIQSSDTVYLEALRYLDPLLNDTAVLHPACKIELAAALAYDEVLRQLTRPGSVASNQDRTAWMTARQGHRFKLRLLWSKYGPKFRQQRLKGTTWPTAIPQPWTPR